MKSSLINSQNQKGNVTRGKKKKEEDRAIPVTHLAVLWKFMKDRCDSR